MNTGAALPHTQKGYQGLNQQPALAREAKPRVSEAPVVPNDYNIYLLRSSLFTMSESRSLT